MMTRHNFTSTGSLSFVFGALCWLVCTAPVAADPKPLTKEEQAKVDQAIDKGVAFLKRVQTNEGDFGWKMYEVHLFQVGQCALPAYALLEAGVPVDDPVIQRAAAFLRPRIPVTAGTYELSLAILFFDRLGDPKDKKLIQGCALRLIAGQHRTGGWAYRCPILNDKNALDLLDGLEALNKRREGGKKTRGQALAEMEVPLALQTLTIFQAANRVPSLKEPFDGDNSNTQFALLGLWAARRHSVAVEPVLEISVERFERSQDILDGSWSYYPDSESRGSCKKSMTCVGLIALAIGRGLNLPTPGAPPPGRKDAHVLGGLAALRGYIGQSSGNLTKPRELEDLYFLWSLERAAMLFDLPDIGGKDWYRWGAQGLITNQTKVGGWPDASEGKGLRYKPTLCTSFALLFLKRSHPMKDLTAKLPFTAKELNAGITRRRPSDKLPLGRPITPGRSKTLERGSTTTPSEGRRP